LLGNSNVSEKQIVAFLIKNNPNLAKNYAEKIVKIYCIEAKRESINVAVAVAQMALETGFLQFNGAIRKEQNNFAGIGSVHATHRGESFATLEKGIRAHIQHLKVYAKSSPLKMPCVDPRRKFVQTSKFFGKLKTIYDLSGTWAADKNYGEKLAKLIQNLLNKSAIK
jgi:flagellum-specific peptidoglycan hydrolase FlgJ